MGEGEAKRRRTGEAEGQRDRRYVDGRNHAYPPDDYRHYQGLVGSDQEEEAEATEINAENVDDDAAHPRGEVDHDAEEEQAQVPRVVCRPCKPTRAEWEAHQVTHWPYRSWCPHCVAGRAVASPHRCKSSADKEFQRDRVPTISLDHCFIGEQDEEGGMAEFAWLIMYDSNTEALFALPTGTKEAKEWVIVCIKNLIDQLGYSGVRIGMKSDNAKELLAIRRGVSQLREAPTTPIEVPVRESRANGACERAVRTWEGRFRTIKHHLEVEMQHQLSPSHPVWGWCGHWAANMLARVSVRETGRTAYEYVTGHRMRAALACFGEKVWFRRIRCDSGASKADPEYRLGVYLGMAGYGVEHLIGTADGVETSRDIRRLAEGEQWDIGLVHSVGTSLEKYLDAEAPDPDIEPLADPRPREDIDPPYVPIQTRRLRLLPKDFMKYGYSQNCPGCRALRSKKAAQNHSEACRTRIIEELERTQEGRDRIKAAEDRKEKEFREHVQAEDQRQQDNATTNVGGDAKRRPRSESTGQASDQPERKMPRVVASAEEEPEEKEAEASQENEDEKSEEDERSAKRQRVNTNPDQDDNLLIVRAMRGVDLMEIHSPARITKACKAFGLKPGDALDLTNGWDLSRADHRREALRLRQERKPYVVTCSPPCTRFSTLNNLSIAANGPEWEAWHLKEKAKAVEHLKFCALFMKLQHRDQKYFLFEHPAGADSWNVKEIQEVMRLEGTQWQRTDLCQFGLTTRGSDGISQVPARKPTGFMSNSPYILAELNRVCQGQHQHQPLIGGRARAVQEYTVELCRAICKGVQRQKASDRSGRASTPTMGRKELKAFISKLFRIEARKSDVTVPECVVQEKRRQFVNNLLVRSQRRVHRIRKQRKKHVTVAARARRAAEGTTPPSMIKKTDGKPARR